MSFTLEADPGPRRLPWRRFSRGHGKAPRWRSAGDDYFQLSAATNAGVEGSIVVQKVKESKDASCGYNAAAELTTNN